MGAQQHTPPNRAVPGARRGFPFRLEARAGAAPLVGLLPVVMLCASTAAGRSMPDMAMAWTVFAAGVPLLFRIVSTAPSPRQGSPRQGSPRQEKPGGQGHPGWWMPSRPERGRADWARQAAPRAGGLGGPDLPGEAGFAAAYAEAWDQAIRREAPLAVMRVDLDQFDAIDDGALDGGAGARARDIALRSVGQALRRSLREGDLVCRYGGASFAVLLPMTREPEIDAIAARIGAALRALAIAHPAPGAGSFLTARLGVALRMPRAAEIADAKAHIRAAAPAGGENRASVVTFSKVNAILNY